MADQADKSASGTNSQESETIFNSDIGDDWGEAFDSEEEMFSAQDEASSPFFLDENEAKSEPSSPATEKETAKPLADGKQATAQDGQVSFMPKPFRRLLFYCKSSKDNFLALSRIIQIAIGVGLASVLLAVIYINISTPKAVNPNLGVPPATSHKSALPPASNSQNTVPLQTETNKKIAPTSKLLNKPAVPQRSNAIEKISKKWHLPLFFIAITDNDKKSAILNVDLTLLLLLPKDELPPINKEVLTRDIIYQFFNNQPLSEIRRYSLARGEMNRKLRTWIEKQLPGLPLSTIIFNRYQIL